MNNNNIKKLSSLYEYDKITKTDKSFDSSNDNDDFAFFTNYKLMSRDFRYFERALAAANSNSARLKIIERLELNVEEKFCFLLKAIIHCSDPTIIFDFLSYALNLFMMQHEDKIVSILENNEKALSDFILCFKSVDLLSVKCLNLYKRIFCIEKFKNSVLKSSDFDPERAMVMLYTILPQDCAYLIGYSNAFKMENSNYLIVLYTIYFNGILTEKEIREFSLYHFNLDKKNNIFQLPIKEKNGSIVFCLKKFLEEKNGILEFRELRDKYNLDYKTLINFISKYDKTKIYYSLLNSISEFDSDIVDKIKFLAKESVIENIDTISDLSTVTISELSSMPRTSRKVFGNLLGGPDGNTSGYAFRDGYEREIRRIDPDGAYSVEVVDAYGGGHNMAARTIYSDTPEVFRDKFLSASERSVLAVQKLSSITFIIESEVCCITMPINITIEQFTMLKHIFADLTDACAVVIMQYDPDRDITIYVNDGDTMNKDEVLRFIKNYEEEFFSKLENSVTR